MTDESLPESVLPPCPACGSVYTYEMGTLYVCPECAHEWSQTAAVVSDDAETGSGVIKDANGTPLTDGDTVTVIKDLKIKGTSLVVKVGTKVKNIRLVADNVEQVEGKIENQQIVILTKYTRKG